MRDHLCPTPDGKAEIQALFARGRALIEETKLPGEL